MFIENPFEYLGLNEDADKKAIRQAYAKMSKNCHPDEKPEEFEKLQQAYKQALEWGQCRIEDYELENNYDKEENKTNNMVERIEDAKDMGSNELDNSTNRLSINRLISKMESFESLQKPEDFNSPALNRLMDMYKDEKTRKNNKAWQEFFLSDEFLDEQLNDNFGKGLACFLKNIELENDINKVPAQFILELSIAYGLRVSGELLCPDPEVYDCQGFEYLYYETVNIEREDKVIEGILKFYQKLNEEWRKVRANSLFTKPANYVRANSFRHYLKVCKATERGVFTADKSFFHTFFAYLQNNYITENANQNEAMYLNKAVDPCIIKLFIHWINKKSVPLKVIDEIYSGLNLQAAEQSSMKKYYVPLKEAICESYNINTNLNQDEEQLTTDEVKDWIRHFNKIADDFSKGLKSENDNVWQQRVDECLDHKVWKKMYLTKDFIDSILYKIYFDVSPLYMLKSVKAKYEQAITETSNSLDYVNNIIELMNRNIEYRDWYENRFDNIKPEKEIKIEALSNKEIGKTLFDSIMEYSNMLGQSTEPYEEDLNFLTEINDKEEDVEVIKSYIKKAKLSNIRNSFVVLKGKIERRVFEIGMFGECIIDPRYDNFFKKNTEDLKKKVARTSVSVYTIGYLIYTKQYHCPEPIAIGTDGKIYTMISQIKARGFDSIEQLFEKVVEVEELNVFDTIEVYDVKLGYDVKHRNFIFE